MNDPLDDRLAAALHAEAGFDADPSAALDRFEQKRRHRRARAQTLIAVAALVVVVGAGVGVAERGGPNHKNVSATGRSTVTTPADEPQAGAPGADDSAAGPSTTSAVATTSPTIASSGNGTGTGTVVGTVVTAPPPTTPPPHPTTTSAPLPGQGRTVTVTEADSGKSYTLHRGDHLVVQLQGNSYEWTEPASSNDAVLHRTSGSSGTTATATFSATGDGKADVTSTGDAPCRKSTPPCMVPSRLFQVSVTVVG